MKRTLDGATATSPILTIDKMTVTYDPQEDRLRLAVKDSSERHAALWLTQRLANRLVGAIADWLSTLSEPASAAKPSSSATRHWDKATQLAWQQSSAQAEYQPSVPVQADPDAPVGLIDSIDISGQRHLLKLLFKTPQPRAVLYLSPQQAHQWLGILRTRFEQAEWSLQGWPLWVIGATFTDASQRPVLH